jgi:hypothetical protein
VTPREALPSAVPPERPHEPRGMDPVALCPVCYLPMRAGDLTLVVHYWDGGCQEDSIHMNCYRAYVRRPFGRPISAEGGYPL